MKKSFFLGLIIASAVAISAYAARQASTQHPETPLEVAENVMPLINVDEDFDAICTGSGSSCLVTCGDCGTYRSGKGRTIGIIGIRCPQCHGENLIPSY